MNNFLYKTIRPAIFKMDPEDAHRFTIKALKSGVIRTCLSSPSDRLAQNLFGLTFKNPIGLSAGFDKDAEVISPVLRLGFGFTEVGTVTPLPQKGNPRPRVFRDPPNNAVINRMGFPNGGLRVFKPNLERFLGSPSRPGGVVGINIGMNKTQENPAEDYCHLIRELAPLADYLTVNISSPNTPGLRDLQSKEPLTVLIGEMKDALSQTCPQNAPALVIKLAPDLTDQQQEDIAAVLVNTKVDGVILSNTTLDRPDYLSEGLSEQTGGLSGTPVRDKSTLIIRNFYRLTSGKLPIIGVGGISNAEHAYEKIKAGASVVQLYTGMIYEGPNIARNIQSGLIELMDKDGHKNITDAVGTA